MNAFRHLVPATVAGIFLAGLACNAQAQINLNIGPEPNCPYGFYDYAPYACAPSGYYGPEWFLNGAFIGTGPWFHGPGGFRGRVDNHFDGRHGYQGRIPGLGERHDAELHAGRMAQFSGNEMHEGGGHEGGGHEGGGHGR
jgi:hypothetical protein